MKDSFWFKYSLDNCKTIMPEGFKTFHNEEDDSSIIPEVSSWLGQDTFENYHNLGQEDFNFQEAPEEYKFEFQKLPELSENLKFPEVLIDDNIDGFHQPAVVLNQDDPSTKEESIMPDTFSESHYTSSEEVPVDLVSTIRNTLCKLKAKQEQIDAGTYVKSGPGRKRKHDPRTSSELHSLVINYLRKSLTKIVSNRRCKDRKDALITIYTRALKKLTYFLVEQCAAKNMYKRHEASKYLTAFSESHSSFLFSIQEFYNLDLVKSYTEFIVIYFPLDKARELINLMMKQNT